MNTVLQYFSRQVNRAAKVLLIILVIAGVLSIFLTSLMHIAPPQNTAELYQNANEKMLQNPELAKRPDQKLVLSVYRLVSCSTVGEGCENDPKNPTKEHASILGSLTNLTTTALVHPPASGTFYTYDVLANAGFAPKTYAAEGIGFAAIRPFMTVWKAFRNIAYAFLVVIMIIIGFMIMFQFKIKAQTVITVESALPRIVLSLLLITFSYAIAGFLIDLMYIVMALSISLLSGNGTYFPVTEFQNKYLTAGPGIIIDSMMPQRAISDSIGPIGKLALGTFVDVSSVDKVANIWNLSTRLLSILPGTVVLFIRLLSGVATVFVTTYVTALINNTSILRALSGISALTFSAGEAPAAIGGIILLLGLLIGGSIISVPLVMSLFVFLTIIFLFFRIFFLILTTYLRILLLILFAPLFMLANAIPGRNAFSYWLKSLIGELLTFPVITILFLVGYLIVNNFQPPSTPGTPPITNYWQPPYIYGVDQTSFVFVAGMGLLFMIPELVKIVKDMLGIKPLPVSFGIGTFFAGAAVGMAGATGLGGKALGLSNQLFGTGAAKDKIKSVTGVLRRPFSSINSSGNDTNSQTVARGSTAADNPGGDNSGGAGI